MGLSVGLEPGLGLRPGLGGVGGGRDKNDKTSAAYKHHYNS